jgi:deoxyribonuclease IV
MHERIPKFGVAGFPPNFIKSKYKKSRDNIFEWLHSLELDWVELQNTYGVKMPEAQALRYKELAAQFNIGISIHAPYFITLASSDPEIVKRSQERIMQAFRLADIIGAERVIFHPGHFPGKLEDHRKQGIKNLIARVNEIKDDLPTEKVKLYPEIAGKINQLGSLMEIVEICDKVSFAQPCLDLAHLHAREGGSLVNTVDIINVFDIIEKYLGRDTLQSCHIHMYPVGLNHFGENEHRAFADRINNLQYDMFDNKDHDGRYYPQAEPFIEAILHKRINPIVICEAKDTQDVGAILMKNIYFAKRGK